MAGYIIFVGVAQFVLFMLIAEAIYPGYSVSRNYISDLGNLRLEPSTPHAAVFNTSIMLLGILLIAGGALLYRSGRDATGRALGALVMASGVGAAGVGLFPEGSPHGLHIIFSLVTFLASSLASYPASLYRGLRTPLWGALGTIGLMALALYVNGIYLGLGWGGMERLIVYPNLLWAAGFSGALLGKEKG
ncbi:hypothetical protein ASAC_0867 [Acidilobus saccharovorans 345-15]|uniref:DUF998 domain-containing protein n=1 Tax=Acidilobus saccharovorans (strain DSM 16705 / JCM 18335 / VKM B-2471 / 345-15) TaxID=666510 RepID=D9Q1T5_ACIS3|nr:DUF998 domain-containing protein [Acidilobus saccharovorans]ADL19273.1 hypothetical protein ASAC_0867 [Acidilobus saccharovorans 345-15]